MKTTHFIVSIICILTLLTGCSNNKPSQENTSLENSTRVVNSVVGDWYECNKYGEVYVWTFREGAMYSRVPEEDFGKKLNLAKYTVKGDKIEFLNETVTLKYTDYGLELGYEGEFARQVKLYEHREDAVNNSEEYWTTDAYYETLKDENGYVIIDGVLKKYFTNDKEIVIPDNVTEIGSSLIVTDLEDIDKIILPGNVKKIGKSAFNETPVRCIVMEEGVEEIGEYAFTDSYFAEVYIPESVNYIGDGAFWCREGNHGGKIYVKKGSYAEKYFAEYEGYISGQVIVEE
ncbi:MAG: leucine-rich repeat domain-containing protein [Lachnospiraceae bacterium]|nr:leucine-rich repeat domain-containing protein [Lachnospiraceae bacterium]